MEKEYIRPAVEAFLRRAAQSVTQQDSEALRELAGMTPAGIIAVIQRDIDPEQGDGINIPFLHPHGDEEDICPLCGGTLEYQGDNDIIDDGTIVSWECPECGATGQAAYTSVFDAHYGVCDANGDTVKGRD